MYQKILLSLVGLFLIVGFSIPSKFVSRTGHLHVESHSRYLDVIADNYQVYCELNPSNGHVLLRGLMKSFEFKLGALDQAFNSDRVDLSNYSKFRYEGQILGVGKIDFTKAASHSVEVNGTLYMGGYERITRASGVLKVLKDGTIKTNTAFKIRIEEESLATINKLMKEKLPSVISLDANKLGISRDIALSLSASFRPRR